MAKKKMDAEDLADLRKGIKQSPKEDASERPSTIVKGMVPSKKRAKKVMSKSAAAKKARSGKDMGKKGKNFNKIAQKAAAEYGSVSAGKKVAGAIFQKMRKAGKL